jgi:DNA-binding transcriptional LysR family regulator
MRIQQVRYVMEIANCNSINKAAQRLFISQPTLSNAVKELEAELGITIFERSRTGISLTVDGIEFIQLAEKLLEQADFIKDRYALKDAGAPSRFQVSYQHYAFVAEAFIQFLQCMAPYRYVYNIKETKTLSAIEDVYLKKSALGIICLTPYNRRFITQVLDKWAIDFQLLSTVAPHVFIRKQHPLANKNSIELAELEQYPMLVYEQDNAGQQMLTEEMIILDNPQKLIYTHDRGTTNNIIANTDSFNIGTGYLIPRIIPDEITSVPLKGFDKQIQLGWIHLRRHELSEDATLFVKLISDSLWRNYPGEGFQASIDDNSAK